MLAAGGGDDDDDDAGFVATAEVPSAMEATTWPTRTFSSSITCKCQVEKSMRSGVITFLKYKMTHQNSLNCA